MQGINKVTLIGRTGKTPEIRTSNNGDKVATFSLATSEKYKDKQSGEIKELTEWHSIVLWKGLAEVAEKYVKKGDPLYVEGKIRTRSWDDKDGNKRYTTEIIANNMLMLSSKPQNSGSNQESEPGNSEEDTDLPF